MINDLTKGSPARVIFFYSLPVILGNIFQQVYNLVDNIIVGRFVSYQALAGVGVTNGMSFLILGFIIGTTSGFGVRTAQYFGAGDMKNVRRSIGTSIVLTTLITAILTLISVLGAEPMLRMMGVKQDIFPHASNYITIIYAGLFTQAAYNLVACILRSLGDSKTPLYFLIFSSVLNVLLDLLFVKTFAMGVEGAAIATVLAQFISALLCFVYAFYHYKEIRLSRMDFKTDWSFSKEHLDIAVPMAFQFSVTAIGLIFLNAALAAFPSPYIAGFSAANKITNVFMLVPVSFGVAMANYAGQNFGAGRMDRLRQGVRATVWMSMAVCAASSAVMAIFPGWLTSLFIDSGLQTGVEEIYYASSRYLYVSAALFPFLFLIFTYRNALQGIGKTFWPLMAGFGELGIRALSSLFLPKWFGYMGVTFVDCLAWVIACVMLAVSYYEIIVKKRNNDDETFFESSGGDGSGRDGDFLRAGKAGA